MTYRIAYLEGDGIGPEIVPAARTVLDAALSAAGADPVEWVELPMGAQAIREHGRAMPTENFAVLESCDGWLVGPHDSESYGPEWRATGERIPGAELRVRYDLYANIRPSRNRVGVPSLVSGVDLVIVRENTEGFYSDRNMYLGNGEFMPTADTVISMGLFTRTAIRRIAESAFELASARGQHVTVVHKSNVLPHAFGMFMEECRTVATGYPEITVDDVLFDAMAALLVRRPHSFDVVVTENLFGDTLSDLIGELVGALGMSGSVNAGEQFCMAQAAHGSAPDIAGRGVANPIGMISSGAMLLTWLGGRHDDDAAALAGRAIETAIDAALADGVRTGDLGGEAGTAEMTEAILGRLSAGAGQ